MEKELPDLEAGTDDLFFCVRMPVLACPFLRDRLFYAALCACAEPHYEWHFYKHRQTGNGRTTGGTLSRQ